MTQIEHFMQDYNNGDSLEVIAKRYGKTRSYVQKYLIQKGYYTGRMTYRKKYSDAFENDWDNICYFLKKYKGWEKVKLVCEGTK